MKRISYLLLIVCGLFLMPRQGLALGGCLTGKNGPPPFCNNPKRTLSCPGDPACAITATINGQTATIITLIGWEALENNPDGSITVFDCAGNWATIRYGTTGQFAGTYQPIYFRVCHVGQNIDNCTEPAWFHTPCGSGSSLSNNNGYQPPRPEWFAVYLS